MLKIPERLRAFLGERRTHDEKVAVDRRRKVTHRDAEQRLRDAVEDFDKTIRMHIDDIKKRTVANDIQQTVKFHTFREICDYKLDAGEHRLCRHPEHEAANTGIARCTDECCPLLEAAMRAA